MDGYEEITLLTPRRLRALGWIALAAVVLAAGGLAVHQVGLARLDELRRTLARQAPPEAPPRPEDGEPGGEVTDAARALLAAAGAIEEADERAALRELRRRRPAAWSEADWRLVRGHLEENRQVREALHGAAALPDDGFGRRGTPRAPLRPHVPPWELLAAGRLLELEGHAAAADGDLAAAGRSAGTLARLGGLAARDPYPTSQLLALAVHGGQLRVLREIVAAGPSPELLPRLEATLADADERAALARTAHAVLSSFVEGDVRRRARRIGRRGGPLWHGLSAVAGELLLVEAVRGWVPFARAGDRPFRRLMADADAAGSRLPLGPFEALDGVETELRSLALSAAKTEASRRLARLAILLAATPEGSHPVDLPDQPAATTPNPLTGSLPTWRLRADGGAELAYADLEAKASSATTLDSLPFAWELPPPGAAAPRAEPLLVP